MSSRNGFTLLEMLTVVAGLVIVMGLMVSLARYVRATSADRLTRRVLQDVDTLVSRYAARHGKLPRVPLPTARATAGRDAAARDAAARDAAARDAAARDEPDRPDPISPLDEASLARAARANNQTLLSQLRRETLLSDDPVPPGGDALAVIAPSVDLIRDAWGTPLIYMSAQHPQIGMAPGNRPFCFSAGPDRLYLTREDNLYSYENR